MPRRREISEILNMMKKTQNIRNIGLVGHIDHGNWGSLIDPLAKIENHIDLLVENDAKRFSFE